MKMNGSFNGSQLFQNNSTSLHLDKSFIVVYDLLLILLGLSIICGNIIVVAIYLTAIKIRQKTANLLLFNQALVDLYNGIFVSGITVFGKTQFHAKHLIYQFAIALSLHTVVLVSLERYVFILRPLFHKRSVTRFRMKIAVILCWLSSLLWLAFRMGHLAKKNINISDYIVYYIAISDMIIFALIILVTYIHLSTYRAVRSFIKNRYKKLETERRRISQHEKENLKLRQHLKELKVSKIFLSMFIAFIFSYIPVFVTGLIHVSGASNSFTPRQMDFMSLDVPFYLLNCLFNPIVTLAFKEDYRNVFFIFFNKVSPSACSAKRRLRKDSEAIEVTSFMELT